MGSETQASGRLRQLPFYIQRGTINCSLLGRGDL